MSERKDEKKVETPAPEEERGVGAAGPGRTEQAVVSPWKDQLTYSSIGMGVGRGEIGELDTAWLYIADYCINRCGSKLAQQEMEDEQAGNWEQLQ